MTKIQSLSSMLAFSTELPSMGHLSWQLLLVLVFISHQGIFLSFSCCNLSLFLSRSSLPSILHHRSASYFFQTLVVESNRLICWSEFDAHGRFCWPSWLRRGHFLGWSCNNNNSSSNNNNNNGSSNHNSNNNSSSNNIRNSVVQWQELFCIARKVAQWPLCQKLFIQPCWVRQGTRPQPINSLI